jgi:hypothetical protein
MSARVHISLFNLIVEVESDFKYPDQMQDMSNRAMGLFMGAIEFCKANNLDIRSDDVDDFIEDGDD